MMRSWHAWSLCPGHFFFGAASTTIQSNAQDPTDIASADSLAFLKRALYGVVFDSKGTAHKARPKRIEIAGKTGTAQVFQGGRRRRAMARSVSWRKLHFRIDWTLTFALTLCFSLGLKGLLARNADPPALTARTVDRLSLCRVGRGMGLHRLHRSFARLRTACAVGAQDLKLCIISHPMRAHWVRLGNNGA
jgi:hypothetical protein